MAVYKGFFKKSVWKDLESIPKKELSKILERIRNLSDNPRPSGSLKLSGQEWYRIRQGRYRVLDSIQKELTIWIVGRPIVKKYIGKANQRLQVAAQTAARH